MNFQETITATASLDRTWSAVRAVTTWPQWTKSMKAVRPLDGEDIQVGNRFRISQPGLPTVVWQVNDVHDGESFTWQTRSVGVRTVAFHRLTAEADGTTRITIGLDHQGPLAGLIGALTAGKTRRFLALEAAGLKAASEANITRGTD